MLLLLWNKNALHAVDIAKKKCENAILKIHEKSLQSKNPKKLLISEPYLSLSKAKVLVLGKKEYLWEK